MQWACSYPDRPPSPPPPPNLPLPILTIFRLLPRYLEEWWHLLLVSKKRKIVTTGKRHDHDLGLATE